MAYKPILITVDGMDGVGKETLTNALQKKLESRGKTVKRFQFPDYDSMDGQLIRAIQMGTYGGGKDQSQKILDDCLLGALPYAINRMLYYKKHDITWESLQDYDYILFDRNYTSNWLYHASKLYDASLQERPTTKYLESFLGWIDTMYRMEIESTWLQDAVNADSLFLNYFIYGNVETAQKLMEHREGKQMGDQIQESLDLNESAISVQNRVCDFGLVSMKSFIRAIEFCTWGRGMKEKVQEELWKNTIEKWNYVCHLTPISITEPNGEPYPVESNLKVMDIKLRDMTDEYKIFHQDWNHPLKYPSHTSHTRKDLLK